MPSSPEIPHPGTSPARGVRSTWRYTLGSLVFILVVLDLVLLEILTFAFQEMFDAVSGLMLVALLCAVAGQLRYCWFLRAGLGGGLPAHGWTLALLVPAIAVWVLGWFVSVPLIVSASPVWIAVTLAACLLPAPVRWRLLGATAVLLAGAPLLRGASAADWFPQDVGARMLLIYAIGLPAMVFLSLWWWQVVVELDKHRRMAGELAVARERLRFAADLHDIQGHHLQVIALKSELAERLLPLDMEAARTNIKETRLIAKQALEETRSLVSGYRETSLANELENAREVLTAAGAETELTIAEAPAEPAVQHLLGLAVREATTNILRHSNASHATIRLARSESAATLAIANNGLSGSTSNSSTPGTGLIGLRERVAAVGGTLDSSHDGDRFELRLRIPHQGASA